MMPMLSMLPLVGAAAGCDLLIVKKQDQKIAAFGSSYKVALAGVGISRWEKEFQYPLEP